MKKEKGYITIEASLVLIGFFLTVFAVLSVIRFFTAEILIHRYLTNAALEISEMGLFDEELSSGDTEYMNRIITITDGCGNYDDREQMMYMGIGSGDISDFIRKDVKGISGFLGDQDKMLSSYGVVGGLGGLDFSESTMSRSGKTLTVRVKYKYSLIELPFFRDLGFSIDREQSVTTGVW